MIPSPGDLPNPGIKPGSPALQADYLPAELSGKPCHILEGRWQMGDNEDIESIRPSMSKQNRWGNVKNMSHTEVVSL